MATQPNNENHHPLVIGLPVTDQGIPFNRLAVTRLGPKGCWEEDKRLNLHLIPDYLRDASGKPVELSFKNAMKAITVLNGGIQIGDGSTSAIEQAVLKGEFKDGTLILARLLDLIKLACKLEDKDPALETLNKIIANETTNNPWCVSSTKDPGSFLGLAAIHCKIPKLPFGANGNWIESRTRRSHVIVLRGFNPPAP